MNAEKARKAVAVEANIADRPKTKATALSLLFRIAAYYKKSGQAGHPRFDAPFDSHETVMKLHARVFKMWRRDSTEPTKVKFRRVRLRHRLSRRNMKTPKRDVVPMIRHALPQVYRQGFLRKRVAVFPYREMDSFMPMHRVNVYTNAGRFDVIDALCNIPILNGISKRELKTVVEW